MQPVKAKEAATALTKKGVTKEGTKKADAKK